MAEMLVYPLDNTYYQANGLGSWLATRDRGVFSADDNLRVESAGGMSVKVFDGLSWHKMSKYWGCSALLENPITLTSEPSDGVLDRYDIAVERLNKITNIGEVVIKKGDFSSTPVIPGPIRDSTYDENYLAAWLVRHGSVDINVEDIQDLRLNEQYCGLMRDGVEKIPTAALNAQAEALINHIKDVLAGVIDGSQYMLKAQYDSDDTGAVDNADNFGGWPPAYYGLAPIRTTGTIVATWTGSTAPYTQAVYFDGIKETDYPHITPVYSSTNATAILQKEAWSMIGKAVADDDYITFTCFEDKPTTEIPIQVEVLR